jgi:hypothetical protein
LLSAHGVTRHHFRIAQIKEKFGGLRFYYDLAVPETLHDRIEKRIGQAEDMSLET